MRILIAAALLILVAGCAPKSKFPDIDPGLAAEEARKQRIAVAEARIRDQARLWDVAFRIGAENTALCGKKAVPGFGFLTVTEDLFEGPWKEAWRALIDIGERPTILTVASGSPAERAGLTPGDRLLRIGDTDLGTGRRAMAALPTVRDTAPMDFVVRRGGAQRTLTARPVVVCDYPAVLVNDEKVNASADGKRMAITTGMLHFAREDEELALIVGHELAHNTRGHIESKTGNMIIGGLLGAAASVLIGVNVTDVAMQAGAGAFSQEFEAEADYVGVYHAARAGYDVHKAASFWRRLAVAHPQSIHLAGSTHPSTAKRFLAIETAAEEVARKRADNAPLVPDER